MKKLQDLTAVILAGGLGTRLRPLVPHNPKVLSEVKGRPFLAYLLDQLEASGMMSVVLCTGYLGAQVQDTFGDSHGSMKLLYSREQAPLGTAGALRLALPLLESDPVLVMNGDSYCNVDLKEYMAFHCEREAEISLALVRTDDAGRYGSVSVDEDGRIMEFSEKSDNRGTGLINAGIYLIAKSVLAAIPPGEVVSLECDIFPERAGRNLYGYYCCGKFIDIGTPQSYRDAADFLEEIIDDNQ